MNYHTIKKYDIANGLGCRTSIFFTGCNFACEGCFNKELWNKNNGKKFTKETLFYLIDLLGDPHCAGLSVLGGEPLIQGEELKDLLVKVKLIYPEKDIWLWTGYYLDELNEEQKEIIKYCDYVIDGRFDKTKADKKLRFRGSSNQTVWHNDNGIFKPEDL